VRGTLLTTQCCSSRQVRQYRASTHSIVQRTFPVDAAILITPVSLDNGPEGQWIHHTGPPGKPGMNPGSTNGLRGRKRDLTEGGIRVPGLMEWPARIKKNIVTDFPAATYDYKPTVMAIIGVNPPRWIHLPWHWMHFVAPHSYSSAVTHRLLLSLIPYPAHHALLLLPCYTPPAVTHPLLYPPCCYPSPAIHPLLLRIPCYTPLLLLLHPLPSLQPLALGRGVPPPAD
jgi:hypothetical protein